MADIHGKKRAFGGSPGKNLKQSWRTLENHNFPRKSMGNYAENLGKNGGIWRTALFQLSPMGLAWINMRTTILKLENRPRMGLVEPRGPTKGGEPAYGITNFASWLDVFLAGSRRPDQTGPNQSIVSWLLKLTSSTIGMGTCRAGMGSLKTFHYILVSSMLNHGKPSP